MLVAKDWIEVSMPRGYLKPTTPQRRAALKRLKERSPIYVLAAHGDEFYRTKVISHHNTCFILDIGHDWSVSDGKFRLQVEADTVVLVFEVDEVLFCPNCGQRNKTCDCEVQNMNAMEI